MTIQCLSNTQKKYVHRVFLHQEDVEPEESGGIVRRVRAHPPEYATIEARILDRKGYFAPWLEKKLTEDSVHEPWYVVHLKIERNLLLARHQANNQQGAA